MYLRIKNLPLGGIATGAFSRALLLHSIMMWYGMYGTIGSLIPSFSYVKKKVILPEENVVINL
eukprot:scaffold2871_cov163-Amphora_coffeaeformis.AAC.4